MIEVLTQKLMITFARPTLRIRMSLTVSFEYFFYYAHSLSEFKLGWACQPYKELRGVNMKEKPYNQKYIKI